MRNLLPILYHKITKGAMKWQLQKTASGKWRVQVYYDGKTHSITRDTNGGQKYFFKSQQKPIDNYSGIVYNKATIKQGAKALKGVKNEKHGKRKR